MEIFTRRHILKTSLASFYALCSALPMLAARALDHGNRGLSTLNWDLFVERLELTAKKQYDVPWERTAYVESVSRILKRLNRSDPFLQNARAKYTHLHPYGPEFLDLLRTQDIQISLISFEKGEFIPHHNHPSMTGVLTCATGSLAVTSYDRVESIALAPRSGVLLKQAAKTIVTPGTTSTLTDTTRNIHFVKALSFTQVIDIFTPPYNSERTHNTTWFAVDERPVNAAQNLFLAHPY